MKTITIIAEQVTDRALSAVIPTRGVASVRVGENRPGVNRGMTDTADTATYRAFRNPTRFDPAYRIELVVDDDVVETVVDSVSVAYGAGFFSDSELWVGASALALSA